MSYILEATFRLTPICHGSIPLYLILNILKFFYFVKPFILNYVQYLPKLLI